MPAETLKSHRLRRTISTLIGAFLLLSAILAFFLPILPPGKSATIRIGVSRIPSWPLIFIAEQEKYFQKVGVDAKLHQYPSSRAAMDGLLAGDVDIAVAMDTSIAREALAGNPIVVIAQEHSSPRLTGIVARMDRGINKPSDLAGKNIGYHVGTSAEAFLKRLLAFESVSLSKVNLVPLEVADSPDALANGKVDAVAIWEPWISRAKKKLPAGSSKVFYNEIMSETGGFVTRRDVVEKNRIAIERTLQALGMAFDLYLNDRDRAFFAMQKALQQDVDLAASLEIWSHLHVDFNVSNHLLWSIQQEVLWMNRAQNADGTSPDVGSYVDASLLRSVRPDLVLLY